MFQVAGTEHCFSYFFTSVLLVYITINFITLLFFQKTKINYKFPVLQFQFDFTLCQNSPDEADFGTADPQVKLDPIEPHNRLLSSGVPRLD